MGECDAEAAGPVMASLQAGLVTGEVDALYLHQLEAGSPLLAEARRAPGLHDRFARSVRSWRLDLPPTYEQFLDQRSRAVRKNLRRYARRIRAELPGLRVACYRDPGDLERIVRDSVAVARRTYHQGLGVAFTDEPRTRQEIAQALAAGWFRGYLLYQDERPIAFGHALHYGTTLYTRDTGFDPEFASWRPGIHLLACIIEEHCAAGTRTIDYGVMDAEYKRQLGSTSTEHVSTWVFAASLKGLGMGFKRALTGAVDRGLRRFLGATRARRLSRTLRSRV
jgi:CelD/BcsL family acetyltransferase involved in cellulose biosynthesis